MGGLQITGLMNRTSNKGLVVLLCSCT